MKRDRTSTKRLNQEESCKRLTYIKSRNHVPLSPLSSSSSSVYSNAEALPSRGKTDQSTDVSGRQSKNPTQTSSAQIPSSLSKSVSETEKPTFNSFLPVQKLSSNAEVKNSFRGGPPKLVRKKSTKDDQARRTPGDGAYEDPHETQEDSTPQSDVDVGQGKFTSPSVLSGDVVNMKTKTARKIPPTGMHTKLPLRLSSSKLNRSRSNLSSFKGIHSNPYMKSSMGRRSVSRSKLSGSRKNLVPPAPPVRTVSLKNSSASATDARIVKQKNSQEVGISKKKSLLNGPIALPGSTSNQSHEVIFKGNSKSEPAPEKKFAAYHNDVARSRPMKHFEQNQTGRMAAAGRNKGRNISQEIEANLTYVNLPTNALSGSTVPPQSNKLFSCDLKTKHQLSSKKDDVRSILSDRGILKSDEGAERDIPKRLDSLDIPGGSMGRKLGSKFNYVVKKTGITDRRDSKIEQDTSDYSTIESIRRMKANMINAQPSSLSAGSRSGVNTPIQQRRLTRLIRLNSEPGGPSKSETGNAYSQSIPQGSPIREIPSARSRLGSVPTLWNSLPMQRSTGEEFNRRTNVASLSRPNVCRRSMSDVGNSFRQRSTLTKSPERETPSSFSSSSLRQSQNSAFSPFSSFNFNSIEQEEALERLSNLQNFSESQNRALNRLHLVPFQDQYPTAHNKYRLSQCSLPSVRSYRSNSNFMIPVGRSSREVQDLHMELEHAQSRINSLTSQLTSNVRVVASFEQNLEKMLNKLYNMSINAGAKDSEISELKTLLHRINNQTSKDQQDEYAGKRISRSCEDLLSCDSKSSESPMGKKERKKNWLMSSISKAFLRNKSKAKLDGDILMYHMRPEQQQGREKAKLNNRKLSLDSSAEQNCMGGKNFHEVRNLRETCKVKNSVGGQHNVDHHDSLQLNIRTKSGTAEISVKQFTNKNHIYGLFVVVSRDVGVTDQKNLCKILAGQIEITTKTSWLDLDAKIQNCFEEHLKMLDENRLDLSRESILNYNVGGLWRSIGESLPEFLPCGYLVGDCDSVHIYLKGLNEKSLEALSYETLHRCSALHKCCKVLLEQKHLFIIGRPDNSDSYLLKKISYHLSKRPDSIEVIDLKGKKTRKAIESFIETSKFDKSKTGSKLLIIKNVDYFDIQDKCHLLLQDFLHMTDLRVIGEADAFKESMAQIPLNFQCWVWPDEYVNFCKRHLMRKLMLSNQLANKCNSDEESEVLVQWLCSFMEKLNGLGNIEAKKDLKQFLTCPLEKTAAQAWLTNFWHTIIYPRYLSKKTAGESDNSLSGFLEWIESTSFLNHVK